MASKEQHELLFIDSFVEKSQQERFLSLIKKKNGRKKLRSLLSHNIRFSRKHSYDIPSGDQTTDNILKILLNKNAGSECYLISEHSDLDEKCMGLQNALDLVVGSGLSTIISCSPGQLAYYEGEDANNRIILEKS